MGGRAEREELCLARTSQAAARKSPKPAPPRARATRDRPGQLAKYKSKRQFDQTPEPGPEVGRGEGNCFVVQKHAARRLHYDFRLELDGVLKSWAVTRGPSIDPADRRLAVHVEDHPLAYGSFEGTIPGGQYGAGTVMVWDQGTWEPIGDGHKGYAEGKLKFVLHGQHLKGGWTLVRMRGRSQEGGRDNWLLIKERDQFALPGNGDSLVEQVDKSALSRKTMEQLERSGGQWISSRPANTRDAAARSKKRAAAGRAPTRGARRGALENFVPPQLATPVARPPNGEAWVHEIKLDGYRIYCRRDARGARLLTRTGQDWTDRFRRLVGPLEALPANEFALDGEVVVLDDDGHSSFGALQEALSADDQRRLTLFAFDLLHLDGYDLRGAALADRKGALRELIEGGSGLSSIRYSDHIEATGEEVFRHASEMGLEGVVSKQRTRPYRSGRTLEWVKSKCQARQEFVIAGFTHSKKGGAGIGALVVGYFEGDRLLYAGRVGTGFTREMSLQLRKRLEPLRISKSLVEQVPPEMRRGVSWVKLELVCEVEFLAWTRDGVLRQASFEALREDKSPRDVVRERPQAARETKDAMRKPGEPKSTPTAGRDSAVAGIAITHANRVVFPDIGATKLDVARYYEAVADVMVPHLRDRPLSLLRCPDGAGATCFFQKHFGRNELQSLSRISVQERKGKMEYLVLHSTGNLVELAQHGVVELHPWGCHADDLERPDQVIFDLDPDPSVAWSAVVETALALKQHLGDMGLVSFAKTTGGKGLHVVVPLQRKATWAEVKEFARAFAESVVEAAPSMFTANPLKRLRKGKIFVDYLRNDKGSTAVAPYSVRAREGAPVSMPMPWSEITEKLAPQRFTLRTVPALISKRADPWRDMSKTRQTITARARRAVGL
jgi:bifunctional non-homologous end joining protein LigD